MDATLDLTCAELGIDGAADVMGSHDPLDCSILGKDHHLGRKAERHMCDGLLNILIWRSGEIADEFTVESATNELFE